MGVVGLLNASLFTHSLQSRRNPEVLGIEAYPAVVNTATTDDQIKRVLVSVVNTATTDDQIKRVLVSSLSMSPLGKVDEQTASIGSRRRAKKTSPALANIYITSCLFTY